jgi:DNA-binding NtrC family response regulator
MVVKEKGMRLLVVEQNELVSKIFKKIFDEKQYEADFAKNDSECLERFSQNYDYIVVENSQTNPSVMLEQKIRQIKPAQKFFSLSRYINYDGPAALKETQDLIEKPFAMLTMVAKLERELTNRDY